MEAQTTPVAEEVVTTTEPVTEPQVVPTGETPAEPQDDPLEEINAMSDEQIQEMIDALMSVEEIPTRPTSFIGKEEEKELASDLTAINLLLDKASEAELDAEKVRQEAEVALAAAEEFQKTIEAKDKEISTINELYSQIETVLSPEVAQAIVLNDTENIPLYLVKENRERVENHPVVGPLYKALLSGENVNISSIVKDAVAKWRPAVDITQVSKPEKVEEVKAVNPMDAITRGMMAKHGSIKK